MESGRRKEQDGCQLIGQQGRGGQTASAKYPAELTVEMVVDRAAVRILRGLHMESGLVRRTRLQRGIRQRDQPCHPEVAEQAQGGKKSPVREKGSQHSSEFGRDPSLYVSIFSVSARSTPASGILIPPAVGQRNRHARILVPRALSRGPAGIDMRLLRHSPPSVDWCPPELEARARRSGGGRK